MDGVWVAAVAPTVVADAQLCHQTHASLVICISCPVFYLIL